MSASTTTATARPETERAHRGDNAPRGVHIPRAPYADGNERDSDRA